MHACMSHEPEAPDHKMTTDLDFLAGSIHGGKGEGLVVGLPLPNQPLHSGGILSAQCTLLQASQTGDARLLHTD